MLPTYFRKMALQQNVDVHTYNTRNQSKYVTPKFKYTIFKHLPRYWLPQLLNKIEDNILNKIFTHSIQGFSKYIKKNILDKYQHDCNLINCYICDKQIYCFIQSLLIVGASFWMQNINLELLRIHLNHKILIHGYKIGYAASLYIYNFFFAQAYIKICIPYMA